MPEYQVGDRVIILSGGTYAGGEVFSLGEDGHGNPWPTSGVTATVVSPNPDSDGDIVIRVEEPMSREGMELTELSQIVSSELYIHIDYVMPNDLPTEFTPETIDAYLGDST